MKIWFPLFVFLSLGCATKPFLAKPQRFTSSACQTSFQNAALEPSAEKQLNRISDLFISGCYREVITLGSYVRDHHRDKFYNVTAEIAEIATPEGSFTEYTLESYERSYLSLLLSMSFMNLVEKDSALVELRKSVMDEKAKLYNYGYDPVITLLQAAIWSNIEPTTARPFWQRLSVETDLPKSIQDFSKKRISEIDEGGKPEGSWKILGYGTFPSLEWKTDFIEQKKGPFKIQAKSEFPKACATESTVLLPTQSWVEKLSRRHERDYHPLLYTKSIARIPFGVVYGIVGVSSGIAVGVGGCTLAAYAESGDLCKVSLMGAGYLIEKTGNLVEYTVAPDMRHWENIPTAFYIVREPIDSKAGKCLSDELLQYTVIKKLWK